MREAVGSRHVAGGFVRGAWPSHPGAEGLCAERMLSGPAASVFVRFRLLPNGRRAGDGPSRVRGRKSRDGGCGSEGRPFFLQAFVRQVQGNEGRESSVPRGMAGERALEALRARA